MSMPDVSLLAAVLSGLEVLELNLREQPLSGLGLSSCPLGGLAAFTSKSPLGLTLSSHWSGNSTGGSLSRIGLDSKVKSGLGSASTSVCSTCWDGALVSGTSQEKFSFKNESPEALKSPQENRL